MRRAAPLLLAAAACAAAGPPLPAAMKGYELYSWREEGDWSFTLVTGTNRMKNADEIRRQEARVEEGDWVKIRVRGAGAMERELLRLPPGAEVYWSGDERPDAATAARLAEAAARRGARLVR